MKWIMIIIVCIGADCQQFTPEKLFDSYEECQVGAGIMNQYYIVEQNMQLRTQDIERCIKNLVNIVD